MDEPFVFEFSPEILAGSVLKYECPEDFKFKISYAQAVCITMPQMNFIKQFYSGSCIFTALLYGQVKQQLNVITKVKNAYLAFMYVMEGDIGFQLRGQPETVIVQRGKCFLVYVPPGDYPSPLMVGNSMVLYFVLHPRLMKKVMKDYPEFEAAFQKLLNNDPEPELFHLCDISNAMYAQLIKLSKHKPQKMLEIESAILTLFDNLIEAQLQQLNRHQYLITGTLEITYLVYEAIRVEAFLGPIPTIEQLANKYNIGYRTLLRSFKKVFGLTLHDFIINEKMDAALYLLAKEGLPVSEISERLGYSDSQSFSRLFKNHFGYSPSEIRAQS